MELFYQPDVSASELYLSEEESKHVIKVLRKRESDKVILTDGKGTEAHATIIVPHERKCLVKVDSRTLHPQARPYRLHILFSPPKNNERTEWFLEKAVECGVDSITCIESQNSERARVNIDRLYRIAISAMKQSKQWYLPAIHPILPFHDACMSHAVYAQKYIAWCDAPTDAFLPHLIAANNRTTTTDICIAIGPEGDFIRDEIQIATQYGFVPVNLGDAILRTETAALFSVMICKTICT